MIVHDPTIERETTGTGAVDQQTWKTLRMLKKRYRDGTLSESHIATLEELLLAGKGRILFKPDLKSGVIDHFDDLARLIVRLDMQDHVMIRTGMSDFATIREHFNGGTPKVEIMFKLYNAEQMDKVQSDFQPLTVEVNISKGAPVAPSQRAAIEKARALGILVETHAYNDKAQLAELAEIGVRMFHTAKPAPTLQWLRSNDWRVKNR